MFYCERIDLELPLEKVIIITILNRIYILKSQTILYLVSHTNRCLKLIECCPVLFQRYAGLGEQGEIVKVNDPQNFWLQRERTSLHPTKSN
jgi:hypothetical protein